MMRSLLGRRWPLGLSTTTWPGEPAVFAPAFRGAPDLRSEACESGCQACVEVCPTQALTTGGETGGGLTLDLGRCVFCPACTDACPTGALSLTPDHRLAATEREALRRTGAPARRAQALSDGLRRILGRALRLRQVSAGGCSGCEAELVATGNVIFDLSRMGVEFVASPRHADALLVTGPVTRAMEHALRATYEAMAAPRLVVAVGACAISGGAFRGAPEVADGVTELLPVDLFIPGCPPHPLTVLDGLLRLLGRLPATGDQAPRVEGPAPTA